MMMKRLGVFEADCVTALLIQTQVWRTLIKSDLRQIVTTDGSSAHFRPEGSHEACATSPHVDGGGGGLVRALLVLVAPPWRPLVLTAFRETSPSLITASVERRESLATWRPRRESQSERSVYNTININTAERTVHYSGLY